MKTKKKVITYADAQFWDMKILGGCCRIIGRDASLHGFASMVMKRFEIIEKLYLSKALLKMAGGGDASPTSPLDSPLPRRAEAKDNTVEAKAKDFTKLSSRTSSRPKTSSRTTSLLSNL